MSAPADPITDPFSAHRDTLSREVAIPEYFAKLASYAGVAVNPVNATEAQEWLVLGDKIASVVEQAYAQLLQPVPAPYTKQALHAASAAPQPVVAPAADAAYLRLPGVKEAALALSVGV